MVTLDEARKIIAAAEKKALAIGQPMNVAVADGGGNLVAHVRMDGAWIGSIDVSIKKAYPAARSIGTPAFMFFGAQIEGCGLAMELACDAGH